MARFSEEDITGSPEAMPMDGNFQFECHKDLGCYNNCCKDADVFLSPYDVLRMSKGLGIPSGEFMAKYTGLIFGHAGLPAVFLEMKDDAEKSCPFVSDDGCSVYEDRPKLCRSFPLKHLGMGNYVLNHEGILKCQGYGQGKEFTLNGWKEDQELNLYNEYDDPFVEVALNHKIMARKIHSPEMVQMFLMAYDMDTFRQFVFESKFLEIFDVDDEQVQRMKDSDVELMKFAITWLKFGLIDQGVLKVRDGHKASGMF